MPEPMISDGVHKLGLVLQPSIQNLYQLSALFTTQDGEWYPSAKPYSIPTWALKWGVFSFMERGAATHILVRVEDKFGKPIQSFVNVSNPSTTTALNTGDKPSGWQNFPIFEGFDPDIGEHGPWRVAMNGSDFAIDGIGLPHKWHVSTFIVFTKTDDIVIPPPVIPPPVISPPILPDDFLWPTQEINLTRPTILRVTGGQMFTLEVR